MNIRQDVLAELQFVVEEFSPMPFPEQIDDDMLLDGFFLDSVALTNLLVRLEERIGFIPSGIRQRTAFPQSIGDLIQL